MTSDCPKGQADDAWRVCAARRWPCSRASAPTTTCVWNRAAEGHRRSRSSGRWRGRYGWTTQPPPISRASATPATTDAESANQTDERVPSSVENLVRLLPLPAFVTGRNFDVLTANRNAFRISPELVTGKNRLRSFFLVDSERDLYRDWQTTARRFVAVVRDTVGRGAARPDFLALVDELSERSQSFRQLWERHDVVTRDTELALLQHPVAGPLQLHLERLSVVGMPEQGLVIYHPTAGSEDARRLTRLLDSPDR